MRTLSQVGEWCGYTGHICDTAALGAGGYADACACGYDPMVCCFRVDNQCHDGATQTREHQEMAVETLLQAFLGS
jgi:hypothetical protein